MRLKLKTKVSSLEKEDPDLFSSFKPLYYLLSVLGLFPYSIKYNKFKNHFTIVEKSFFANLLCGICCFLLMISFFILHLQAIFTENDQSSLTDIIVNEINYLVELMALIIYCLGAYIYALRNAKTYMKILNGFASTWTETKKRQRMIEHLTFQVRVVMGTLLIITAVHLVINFTRQDGMWKIILVTFSFDLPQLIQFVEIAYIVVLMNMVLAMLRSIQEDISGYVKDESKGSDKVPSLLSAIKPFELTYSTAFEISRDLNRCFEAPILLITLQCFHSIVSEGHIIYHGVAQMILSVHEIVNCSVWVLWQLLKMYALAYFGGLLKLETRKVGQILHNIPTDHKDLCLLAEIQHFSTKINYQAIELSVYGYFPLDETLIFKIIAGAMMYLIIFVQFDK